LAVEVEQSILLDPVVVVEEHIHILEEVADKDLGEVRHTGHLEADIDQAARAQKADIVPDEDIHMAKGQEAGPVDIVHIVVVEGDIPAVEVDRILEEVPVGEDLVEDTPEEDLDNTTYRKVIKVVEDCSLLGRSLSLKIDRLPFVCELRRLSRFKDLRLSLNRK
jgi:hypothetical protein